MAKGKTEKKMVVFRGESISPGVAPGKAFIFFDIMHADLPPQIIERHQIIGEKARLMEAIEDSRKEIHELIEKVNKEIGYDESNIFQVHLIFIFSK